MISITLHIRFFDHSFSILFFEVPTIHVAKLFSAVQLYARTQRHEIISLFPTHATLVKDSDAYYMLLIAVARQVALSQHLISKDFAMQLRYW